MDYMKQLDSFKEHRMVDPISASAIALYYTLYEQYLDFENTEFAEWVCVLDNALMMCSGGLSESRFLKARDELIQKDYVEYRQSKNPKAGFYRLIPFG